MRKMCFFLLLNFCLIVFGQSSYGYYQIYTRETTTCPGVAGYDSDVHGGTRTPKYYWKIENGVFDTGTRSVSGVGMKGVSVIWDDVDAVGKLTLTVEQEGETVIFQPVQGDTKSFYILSLKNKKPELISDHNTILPFEKTLINFTASINYTHAPDKKIENFEWILPEGWETTNNKKGTFTGGTSIAVNTESVKSGIVRVRAINSCNSSYSNFAEIIFQRPLPFTKYPTQIPFGDMSFYTFTAQSISGVQYEWKAPTGWSINGGGNTLLSNRSSVQIQALNSNNGKVYVRLHSGNDVSDWYTCPFKGIAMPTIMCNKNKLYQYEPFELSITPELADKFTINWRGEGTVISGQGTNKISVASINTGNLTMYADVTLPGYGEITLEKTIDILPTLMNLKKETDLYGKGKCWLEQRPEGTTLSWEFSDNGYAVINNILDSVKVAPCQYEHTSTLKAVIQSSWMNVVLQTDFTSPEMKFEGDEYVLGIAKRYEVNYLPYNSTLTWTYTPGIKVTKQIDNYIYITARRVLNPWIQATVLCNGLTVTKRIDLHNEGLTGVTLHCLRTWKELVGDKLLKKYAFWISHTPISIPMQDLSFCWEEMKFEDIRISKGESNIETGGNIGPCIRDLFPEELPLDEKNEVGRVFYSRPVEPADPGIPVNPPEPLIPDTLSQRFEETKLFYTTTDLDIAEVTLPHIEYQGVLSCTVSDQGGNNRSASYNLESHWDIVYHATSNPVNNTLIIQKDISNNEIATYNDSDNKGLIINLYNDQGLVRTVNSNTSIETIEIDTSDLPRGNYYLNIVQDGKIMDSQVIMVKH